MAHTPAPRVGVGRASSASSLGLSPSSKNRNARLDYLPLPFSVDHMQAGPSGWPAACKGVAVRQMRLGQQMHLERLKGIKMGVDNSAPRTFGAAQMRKEGRRKAREREAARIQAENEILMRNMYR